MYGEIGDPTFAMPAIKPGVQNGGLIRKLGELEKRVVELLNQQRTLLAKLAQVEALASSKPDVDDVIKWPDIDRKIADMLTSAKSYSDDSVSGARSAVTLLAQEFAALRSSMEQSTREQTTLMEARIAEVKPQEVIERVIERVIEVPVPVEPPAPPVPAAPPAPPLPPPPPAPTAEEIWALIEPKIMQSLALQVSSTRDSCRQHAEHLIGKRCDELLASLKASMDERLARETGMRLQGDAKVWSDMKEYIEHKVSTMTSSNPRTTELYTATGGFGRAYRSGE